MRTVLALTALAVLSTACSDPEPAAPPAPAPASPAEQPAPAPPADPPAPPVTLHEYSCADGLLFDVVFDDQEATLHVREQRFDLHRQPSDSGALYTDEHWSLFTKGERALLSADDLSHECTERASRTLPGAGLVPDLAGGDG